MNWYQNNLKLFFAILLIAPLGFYGLLKRKTTNNSLKIGSIFIAFIYNIFFIIICVGIAGTLLIGNDKIHLDNALLKKRNGEFNEAAKEFSLIEKTSKHYQEAQNEISIITKIIDSLKIIEISKIETQKKLATNIAENKIKWCDSIVKSWNGQFIIAYQKPIKSDTIYFKLSKNASKSFQSNRQSNLPMYLSSYKIFMKRKIGKDFTDNVVIEFIQDEQTKNELVVKNIRREKIMQQFGFDGQHRKLEREIKQMMNDPESYEHIETNWNDKNSYILIETTVRGHNPYGAQIVKTYRAKATIDGEILEIK